MNPEDIHDRAGAIAYIRLCRERLGHVPLAIGLLDNSYNAVVREMLTDPSNRNLRPFLNGVLLVNVDV